MTMKSAFWRSRGVEERILTFSTCPFVQNKQYIDLRYFRVGNKCFKNNFEIPGQIFYDIVTDLVVSSRIELYQRRQFPVKQDYQQLEPLISNDLSFPPTTKFTVVRQQSLRLDSILDGAVSLGQEVIVLGDLNTDFPAKRASIPECRQLKALFTSLQFKKLIDEPTQIASNASTLMDLSVIIRENWAEAKDRATYFFPVSTKRRNDLKPPTTTSKISTTTYNHLKNIYSHSQTI
ncbi:hypothetical protein pdam_00006357 [Pocillopora damicornis]|uniref:Uncharacterized protein n=1 Tax=Pocillopora damicornis TaxID=46731 RepID=A0A3M6TQL2_POCDA|nr:hypothetical protein pdam_00006357 [Pocillopora damicornis]